MKQRALRLLRNAALAATLTMVMGPVFSGSFSISPVRASLTAKQNITSMTVRNGATSPATVQLQVMEWSQEDGKDVLAPTRDVLATPPVFTLAPGGAQVIRLGLRRAPDVRRELTYRLILTEVPPPQKADAVGLAVTLRLSVPVFVVPPIEGKEILNWSAHAHPDGQTRIRLTNSGSAHIQVANLSLAVGESQAGTPLQVAAYVLPGQRREWPLPLVPIPSAGTPLILHAETDAGPMKVPLSIVQP